MTKREAENRKRLISTLTAKGLTRSECETLFRCERALHRWAELECGTGNDYASWCIERDEVTDKPFRVTHFHPRANAPTWQAKTVREAIPDREKGARKRATAIAGAHGLTAYFQTDPRGCALYILRPGDVPAGADASAYYTNGLAICY